MCKYSFKVQRFTVELYGQLYILYRLFRRDAMNHRPHVGFTKSKVSNWNVGHYRCVHLARHDCRKQMQHFVSCQMHVQHSYYLPSIWRIRRDACVSSRCIGKETIACQNARVVIPLLYLWSSWRQTSSISRNLKVMLQCMVGVMEWCASRGVICKAQVGNAGSKKWRCMM